MKSIIYETKGRAKEFSELAINLFNFCTHGCVYCYAPDILHIERQTFLQRLWPRVTEKELYNSAAEFGKKGEKRRVLLCFTCDPYISEEGETQITRKAITALHAFGLNVMILTKGGERSVRDFDLLGKGDAYATTLTCVGSKDSLTWEPGAAPPLERIACLQEAHRRGIETWVSFEPVIFADQTFALLSMTKDFVGHYKVGTMNYHPQGKNTNWFQFGWSMKLAMDTLGVKYYLKKDLLREMGVTDPAKQVEMQTFICR